MAEKTSASEFSRTALFGDSAGLEALLEAVESEKFCCIVCAGNRPQYHGAIRSLARNIGARLLIQPKYGGKEYARFFRSFTDAHPDSIICYSYSMIVRGDILRMVGYNAVNIHGALLPKNRGPNPVQWALIKGEELTGATIHYMNEEVDAGDIIAQKRVAIGATDTWVDLKSEVDAACLGLINEYVPKFLKKDVPRSPQDEQSATKNFRLNADYPKIDFSAMDDREIFNLIRAQVAPLEGAYIDVNGEKMRIREFIPLGNIGELRKKYQGGEEAPVAVD